MRIGAPNSPARWLSENISEIPTEHDYALMGMRDGMPYVISFGTKKEMEAMVTDLTKEVICELSKYRKS